MGYYSDVGLVVHDQDVAKLRKNKKIADILSWADETLTTDGAMLFHWYTKWYGEEVDALERHLSDMAFDPPDDFEDFLFIRVGENEGDVDTRGGWYDNPFDMGYVRRVEFASSTKPAKVVSLKDLNTKSDATNCAQCGTRLSDPVPGMPSMKHCPVCEP